jgi:hypothetical protein
MSQAVPITAFNSLTQSIARLRGAASRQPLIRENRLCVFPTVVVTPCFHKKTIACALIAIAFFTATARIGRRVICRGHYGEFVDYAKTREVVVADRIWVRNIQGLRILFDVN